MPRAALLAMCLLLAGCSRSTPAWYLPATRLVKPERVRFSYVVLADLRAADQLGPGWYEIENGAWRWMGREATVYLNRPEKATLILETKLYLPQNLIERVGAPALNVLLDGKLLQHVQLAHAGEYVLREPVPAGAVARDIVRVDLKLDRVMPPTAADKRELGAVCTAVGFRAENAGDSSLR